MTKPIHTIVAGMGPSGLSSALSLLISGHDVTLIDKRSDYTLRQKVIIPNKLIEGFLNLGIESDYLKKLIIRNGLTSLRKFQDFQMSVLTSIYHDKEINLHGKSVPINGKMQVLQGSDNEVVAVDGDNQTITLKNKKMLKFDNIIDATGKHSHIMTMLKKGSNGKYKIDYADNLPQPGHKANAIIMFNAPTHNAKVAPLNAKNDYNIADFHAKGWEHDTPPTYYIRAKARKNRIYILTQIPEKMANAKDHNKIIEFIKPILKSECGVDTATLKVEKNNVSLFSAFNIEHKIADKPYVQLGKKGVAIVVGDACSPANFHFGHGVTKGIQDGLNLYDVLDEKGHFNSEALEVRCRNIRNEISFYQHVYDGKEAEAEASWEGYLASFGQKCNYTRYVDFVEGQIEARKSFKLGLK